MNYFKIDNNCYYEIDELSYNDLSAIEKSKWKNIGEFYYNKCFYNPNDLTQYYTLPYGNYDLGNNFVNVSAHPFITIIIGNPELNLTEIKKEKNVEYSNMSMQKREELLPTYKLINASLDVYDDSDPQAKTKYKNTCKAFRTEYYRIKAIIDNATSYEEIMAIIPNFPTQISS